MDKHAEYYYVPRFCHFNIYRRLSDGTSVKCDEAGTREEARTKVYKLNGWKLKS
ncbi:MAG: hypothetical protein IJ607_11595 [Bacteroidaceae bacterium]|nr:hypothetical protein [Bacteroidaceae bacterium]